MGQTWTRCQGVKKANDVTPLSKKKIQSLLISHGAGVSLSGISCKADCNESGQPVHDASYDFDLYRVAGRFSLYLYGLFRFVFPALFENEAIVAVYFLFIIGILLSYYVLFPISFRFLGTYSVSSRVESTITLDSYISTFTTLTLLMGVVFQLPVISFILGKMGIINAGLFSKCRKHAFLIILTLAAIITPGLVAK